MAIDFPNSPTNGDLYTVGGKTWQWNGTFWAGYGTSPDLTISDTPPASPNIGDQWFESDTGRWLVYYDNAWVELTSSAVVSPNANDLQGTTLASSVVSSSLTSVGTLGSLSVTGDLTVDTNVLRVDTTNNRVGVNVSSPTSNLDLVGNMVIREASTQDGIQLAGRAGGTGSATVKLIPTTLTANRTLTLPDATGTVARTADVGMRFITSGTFTSQSSVSINNCFSSDYTNYRVVVGNITQSTTLVMRIRMRSAGADNSVAAYDHAYPYLYTTGGAVNISAGAAQTGLYVGDTNSSSNSTAAFSFDVFQPFLARRTIWLGTAMNLYNNFFTMSGGGVHSVESSFDGFTLYTATGTITGNYQVYGYTI